MPRHQSPVALPCGWFLEKAAAEDRSQRSGVTCCVPLMQLALFRVWNILEHAGLSE